MNFSRNNLNKASSPYLQQHAANPIHWQEWNLETLEYAKKHQKIIFVSIGYSTCHWCHVMAHETFSDEVIAEILNEHFVSIKVDREERPDIDQYMMSYVNAISGQGGWPLNVFLNFEQKPLYGGTYFPRTTQHNMQGFREVLEQIVAWNQEKNKTIPTFTPPVIEKKDIPQKTLLETLEHSYDEIHKGFGEQPKFPPHCTVLYLLQNYENFKKESTQKMITETLDIIATRGLHDHLQGGFFRYCVDKNWTTPHFEKMLYDQAMLLWQFSWAYKLFQKPEYLIIIEKIVACLESTFKKDKLYISAHNADTNHIEGETYTWSLEEIQEVYNQKEFKQLQEIFEIDLPNFEGKYHLVKKYLTDIPSLEKKLLETRNKRQQPSTDDKILTSWNALTGIAYVMAYRATNTKKYHTESQNIFNTLIEKHFRDNQMYHSSHNEKITQNCFLEDIASMLLLATYLYEEDFDQQYREKVESLSKAMIDFKKNNTWYENIYSKDFKQITAQQFDHPTPSSSALANLAQFRSDMIIHSHSDLSLQYSFPIQSDFHNITADAIQGNIHIIHTPNSIDWNKLPLNSLQIKKSSYEHCFNHSCQQYSAIDELLSSM